MQPLFRSLRYTVAINQATCSQDRYSTDRLGAGSLRQAISDANNQLGADTINFAASLVSGGDATISLSTFDTGLDNGEFGPTGLVVSSSIKIIGPTSSNGITISRTGGSHFRLFHVTSAGSLELVNLTLSGGNAQGFNGGNAEAPGNGVGGGGDDVAGRLLLLQRVADGRHIHGRPAQQRSDLYTSVRAATSRPQSGDSRSRRAS
ncbi:MAG: hypothetical protein ACJ74W_11425 [Pyrinomonadaceae bacterium]